MVGFPRAAQNDASQWRDVDPVALVGPGGVALPAGTITDPEFVKAAPYTQLGYQQIVSATLASAQGLTVPTGATVATVQNNGTGICRWRPDGSTTLPTASVGQTIAAGATLTLDVGSAGLAAAQFIIGSGTVILDICYFV